MATRSCVHDARELITRPATTATAIDLVLRAVMVDGDVAFARASGK